MTERSSGTILDGKYEILDRLATGGMGEVWKAKHLHLHELRVIKILRADRATDPMALQRFAQEARIATQIKHPNVAILYDFSRLADGSFYMVSEHIEGEDVGTWLKQKGVFPMPLAVELAIQALRGLEAIHAAGVIHRDVSPDNLMITRDRRGRYQLKIIDLGLAKNLEVQHGLEITQAGMFMGKLMYCSPEQAGALKDEPLDHRSDLYSLAAVLYEMITGRPPFESENQHGYVFKRLTEPPLPMIGRNPQVTVPAELNTVVLKGLEKDRESRHPDAISFLHALVKVAEQLRQVATQEVALPAGAVTPVAATSSPRPVSRAGSSSELSREERMELLAQIERAAKKVSESSRLHELAEAAVAAKRYDDAAGLVTQLEALSPRHPGIAPLKEQLAAVGRALQSQAAARKAAAPGAGTQPVPRAAVAEATPPAARPATAPVPEPAPAPAPVESAPAAPAPPSAEEEELAAKVAEAERLLETYLREHKQSLAQFALDTLLELAPLHPRRADYESWVALLGEEARELVRARAAFEEGRQAIRRGDLKTARKQVEAVAKIDPSHRLAETLEGEIALAEKQLASDEKMGRQRQRLEELLENRRLNEAERELERLSAGGLAKVSVESYRLRISDIAALAEREAKSQEFERRFRERVQAKDWLGAREIVLDLERAVPEYPRTAQLFNEVSRYEEVHRRQQGIDQGVRQLESFLAAGKRAEAELALRILLQMEPEHPRRSEFETKISALAR